MTRNTLIIIFSLLLACFFMVPNVQAAWYQCVIKSVVPWSNGETRVQLEPGTGETGFTGTVRVSINGSSPGAKNMLAVALTAVSLITEVSVETGSVPSWDPIEEMTGIGLAAP